MSGIRFDFTNMMTENGISKRELAEYASRAKAVQDSLEGKRGEHVWRSLPGTDKALLDDMRKEGGRIRDSFDSFTVLGIGGSALGSRAMFNALKHLRYNELPGEKRGPRFYVADNVDPDGLSALFDVIDVKDAAFHVITKSGNTVETVTQFMLAANKLAEAGEDLKDHIVITTDKEKGNVKRIADNCGIKTYIVPDGVGGRFSVLSPVGLLSAAVLDIDIDALLKGAADMDALCSSADFGKNPALMYAALCCEGMKRGISINVLMPYADALKDTAEWFCQLWAESLGKRTDNGGKTVNVGQTPVRALGVTDQHSQVQLYSEGPFDKLITFIEVAEHDATLDIPKAPMPVYDAEYLAGQSFNKLIASELNGTEFALKKAGKPNMRITLDKLDAYSFGALIMFFEVATAIAGEYLDINAFDQPGVEEGKLATFALMGREGYEGKAKEMRDSIKADGELIYRF